MNEAERLARIEEQLTNLVNAINQQRADDHQEHTLLWAKLEAHTKTLDGNGHPGIKQDLAAVKARVALIQVGIIGIAAVGGGLIGSLITAAIERLL